MFIFYALLAAGNTWATINPSGYLPVGLSAGLAVMFALCAVREAILEASKRGH
jgi:hypothetical protein